MSERPAPLVSVVTPAYKAARLLPETVASVLAQTLGDLEHVIVEDRGPDDTLAVARALAARDRRVVVVQNARNSGPGPTRSHGLAVARGRYVAFVDADDLWPAHKLATQIAFMRRTGAAFTCTAFRRFAPDGSVGPLVGVPGRSSYARLLLGNTVATSTVVIDRSQVGDVRFMATHYDDFELWLRLARRGFPPIGLDVDLMRYRLGAQSFSANKLKSARETLRGYVRLQRLGLVATAWCFTNYAIRGWLKHRHGTEG